MPIYEGMFLLDSGRAAKDWPGTESLVTHVLERYGAKMLLKDRWDERKLAYAVKKQKRGTYYLAYFEADGDAVSKIRADLLLTEGVLRFLVLAWPEDEKIPEKIEMKRMLAGGGFGGFGGGGGGRREGGYREGGFRDGGGREERVEEPEEEAFVAPTGGGKE